MDDIEKSKDQLLDEIKILKQKALKSEEFNKSIINSAIDAIITIKDDGTIMSWNIAAEKMFGYKQSEIVDNNISILIHNKFENSKSDEKLKRFVKIWLQSKINKTSELLAKRKDGTHFPIELSTSNWNSTNSTYITGIIRDITERKEHFKELNKLNQALKNAKEVIFMTDTDGVFTYINPEFTKMYGYQPEEIIGIETPRILKDPNTKLDYNLFWNKLQRKESILMNQYFNKRKDGSVICIEGSAAPILDTNGMIMGYLGIQHDVTERLMHMENLTEALKKAKEYERLKSEFLATMSHELRTPLNSIIGLSSLIDADTPVTDILEFNDIINSSGEHLLSLIEDLFDISLIESGHLRVNKKNVNLEKTLYDVENFIRNEQKKLDKTRIEINLMIAPEYKKLMIDTDENKLSRILKNLLQNALKFTDEGYINYGFSIYHMEGQTMIKFFIEDTGIGISKEKQDLIFDAFRQSDGSFSRKHEGLGIGLTIAKKLINLLGGNIWVDSVIGKGSSFFFTLPIHVETSLPTKLAQDVAVKNEINNDKTVLIAEDDEGNFEYLKTVLELNKVKYLWAKNGEEAVNYCLDNNSIGLVLMDINMPILKGDEATKQIKKLYPNIPIVIQTAYAFEEDKEKAILSGCNEYVSKPIMIETLQGLIKKYIK
ncbi:MAG: PAS domain S-box protein [Flavobacteriaceae bacterium]|nr:PAS domain S-box protein [Flavobacteriaceae bacterium]